MRELIQSIRIDPANFDFIKKSGIINGSLLIDIERVINVYSKRKSDQNAELRKAVDLLQNALISMLDQFEDLVSLGEDGDKEVVDKARKAIKESNKIIAGI